MKFQDIILLVLFLIAVLFGLWYLFGNSPSLVEALLVFIIALLFSVSIKINNLSWKFRFFERKFNSLEESFIKLANDFKSFKR